MKILIIADHQHQHLSATVLPVVMAAKRLADDIDIIIMGHQCMPAAKQAAQIEIVNKVICADASHYADVLAEDQTRLLQDYLIKHAEYTHILFAASATGKNIAPRLAALFGLSLISEVVDILSADTFVRPVYAGRALVTLNIDAPMKIMTIRHTAFSVALNPKPLTKTAQSKIEYIEAIPPLKQSHFIKREITTSSRPNLTQARIVVAGGRGLGSAEHFRLIEKLADKLNAAVGASRAAVDSGYASNDCQIGQTGKIIAPDLYIAVGISGAIQHLAGIKEAKVIVAINKDEDAPIMQIADYAIVGDFAKVLPELEAIL